MDNSLLLINRNKIEELVLLDEACGSPVDMDWDSTVSEGEIPAVVYRTNGLRLQGAVIHKTPPASCNGNRGGSFTLWVLFQALNTYQLAFSFLKF